MNFTEYEHHVAAILHTEGWRTTVTPSAGDLGLDVIAERDGVRLGVQVKMYGRRRPVNSQIVRELYGAAAYKDCTAFMIATDGRVAPDARATAHKLGVEIRQIPRVAAASSADDGHPAAAKDLTFDTVWDDHIAALEGTTLVRSDGSRIKILIVDGGGIVRLTSGGNRQPLEIEIFRWTIERLLAGEVVTRGEIDDHWIKRGSSGIHLILSSLDVFETVKVGGKMALRLATTEGAG